ncbi:hypothetical protein ACLKA6_000227 [Drosophila palustris]
MYIEFASIKGSYGVTEVIGDRQAERETEFFQLSILIFNEKMNKIKDIGQERLSPISSGPLRSPAPRDRRAVVEMYEGPQMMPDEAMLPMPPHNIAQGPNELLSQGTRQFVSRFQTFLRLLKRRF